MALMHSEYRARLEHWQRTLTQDFYRPLGGIRFEGFTTMEHLTPQQAAEGSFAPVEVLLGGGAGEGEMMKAVLSERLHCCVNHGAEMTMLE